MKKKTKWNWVSENVVFAIHDELLARFGGLDGVRDKGLIESALTGPQNLTVYENPDAADLAAAYAFGLARNHGFLDGNKRTAWVVARTFLADNKLWLKFAPLEAISIMEKTAAGQLTEAELATWFRKHVNHK